jgi:peptidoglycan/LPS O-acetylase OafA/YrhL
MEIEKEIEAIRERNSRVEEDKAWEVSIARKAVIAVLTYAVTVIFCLSASIERPFITAIVPSLAFFLSTLSLPWLKKLWKKSRSK